jgi:hypothetical protein
MARRSGSYWFLGALVFGIFVLPWLVYGTGRRLLGAYAGGGAWAFFGDFLHDLLALRWQAWALALGPLVMLTVWVGLWRLATPRHAARRPGNGRTRVEPYVRKFD